MILRIVVLFGILSLSSLALAGMGAEKHAGKHNHGDMKKAEPKHAHGAEHGTKVNSDDEVLKKAMTELQSLNYQKMSEKRKSAIRSKAKELCPKHGNVCLKKYFSTHKGLNKQMKSWNRDSVTRDLKAYVERSKSSAGFLQLPDSVKNMVHKLTLKKIHTEKILPTPDGTSFVCADFKDDKGNDIDVDFFLVPSKNGSVGEVKRMKVHKINGAIRYTYILQNDRWVEKLVKAKSKIL